MIYVGYSKVLCDSWCDVCSKRMFVDQNCYLRRSHMADIWLCSNLCLREDIEMEPPGQKPYPDYV